MATEILPELHVGDIDEAIEQRWAGFTVVNVLEGSPKPSSSYYEPFLYTNWNMETRTLEYDADPVMLDRIAGIIDREIASSKKVFLHCGAGIERSPLACAWFLWKKRDFASLSDAYDFIVERRPQVQRRDSWVRGLWLMRK